MTSFIHTQKLRETDICWCNCDIHLFEKNVTFDTTRAMPLFEKPYTHLAYLNDVHV